MCMPSPASSLSTRSDYARLPSAGRIREERGSAILWTRARDISFQCPSTSLASASRPCVLCTVHILLWLCATWHGCAALQVTSIGKRQANLAQRENEPHNNPNGLLSCNKRRPAEEKSPEVTTYQMAYHLHHVRHLHVLALPVCVCVCVRPPRMVACPPCMVAYPPRVVMWGGRVEVPLCTAYS